MAKIRNETRVPTSFEMYLACEFLNMKRGYRESIDCLNILEAHIRNVPLLEDYMYRLRKEWYKMIIMGLTKDQINELVNS